MHALQRLETAEPRFAYDVCARAELIIRRFRDIGDNEDMITGLFRAASDLGFHDDIEGVALAFECMTGERICL